ncbi:MAG: transposase [bacterium]|nr:transposase [bacterium]
MSNYKRARFGTSYFFTVVTYQRKKILCLDSSRKILREVIQNVKFHHPFSIEAFVLLPEHIHCIWKLPDGDTNYSMRWGLIKKEFTKGYRKLVGTAHPTKSRLRHREAMVWQRRFWEHQIRDRRDFNTHCDYIHYNPVKHGLVSSPRDWQYSTFHGYVRKGKYDTDWGANKQIKFSSEIGNE